MGQTDSRSPEGTMLLCKLCERLPSEWLVARMIDLRDSKYPEHNQPEHYWTYSSWPELEASAKSCRLCDLVAKESRIEHMGPYKKTDRSGIRWSLSGGSRIEVWCEELRRCTRLNIGFDRDDLPRIRENVDKIFDARIVSKRAGDERNVRTILHWIKFCRENHKLCSTIHSRPLPTRVLDVGTMENPSLRLHASNNDIAEYAALSYCWGTGEKYMTTKDNLNSHLSRVDFADLPPALQDSITLTRLIGLRYIWIDALCIVQGDRDDWTHEASQMHKIYSQASLTIALDLLDDTSSRLFVDRSKRHNFVVPLPWPYETKDKIPVNLYVLPSWQYFSSQMAKAPLSSRGWCFQERALSTRILHMGEDMCYWECKEACVGEEIEIGKYIENDGFGYLKGVTFPEQDGIELSTVRLHEKWAWVIEEFSKRKLSFEGDKLVALEGVTTLFAEKGKLGKHFCGLWEDEFLRHMLWQSERTGITAKHRRPSKYRAPSWSWAGVDGPVTNPFIKRAMVRTPDGSILLMEEMGNDNAMGTSNLLTHKILTISSIEVENEGETPFGSVLRGNIKATGLLVPVKRGVAIREGIYVLETLAGDVVGSAIWDVDVDVNADGQQRLKDMFLCPIMQCRDTRDGWSMSECLILKLVEGVAPGGEGLIFKRVAKGRIRNFFALSPLTIQSSLKTFAVI